jgi:sulfate adenylyltransferase
MPLPHGGKLVERALVEKRKDEILKDIASLLKINVDRTVATDIQNIAYGVFSPLEGFLTRADFENVLYEKRLATDVPWTIPIVLDVEKKVISNKNVKNGDTILITTSDIPVALMQVEEIYSFDRKKYAQMVFQTTDINHPGVAHIYRMQDTLIGGKIDLVNVLKTPFDRYALKPIETRILFKEKGWKQIVAFQTRNPPHVGHEWVQKTALTFADGIFINPIIGKKKKGDFTDDVILEAYDALIKHYYLKERAVLAILQTEMKYAGPREAIHHAIIRKNFGCTHIIIGRDHAGVGNYYKPYAAQEIFNEFSDLGIIPVFFKSFFYCKKCEGVANEKICPHGDDVHIKFSGTKIRDLISAGKTPPHELMRPEVANIILRNPKPFVD